VRTLDFNRRALSICAAAALLAACGGQTGNTVPAVNGAGKSLPYHKTFHYTGTEQPFKVPAGVTKLTVIALGAAGATDTSSSGSDNDYFGRGGRVYAIIPVKSGETLYVVVGGQGSTTGGFNGGGKPGYTSYEGSCFGGGGASDVREDGRALRERILVAAGGGGSGCNNDNDSSVFGGDGGPAIGENGGSLYGASGGSGGTQSTGGAGGSAGGSASGEGTPGRSGKFGHGGNGGDGGLDPHCNGSNYFCSGGGGGGGGGGYYGGGGGGGGGGLYFYGQPGAGGGGGSSYVEPSAYAFRSWRGWKTATGNGLVVFDW
jgi:hypothetical protein